MGNTHGRKWTDNTIKESILEVVKGFELRRMPTRSECIKYFNNHALSDAVTRRGGGWYKLAKDLGLPIKSSETTLGKRYEEIIAKMLEDKGFITKKMSQNFPYDILVDKCVKIDVKVSHLYKGKEGNFYTFSTGKKYATCDIYILISLDSANNISSIFIIPSTEVIEKTQISIGQFQSKYLVYIDRWETIQIYSKFMRRECMIWN